MGRILQSALVQHDVFGVQPSSACGQHELFTFRSLPRRHPHAVAFTDDEIKGAKQVAKHTSSDNSQEPAKKTGKASKTNADDLSDTGQDDTDDENNTKNDQEDQDRDEDPAVARAKTIIAEMKAIATTSLHDKQEMRDMQMDFANAEARHHMHGAAAFARNTLERDEPVNKVLRQLYIDRDRLHDHVRFGAKPDEPFAERADLERLAGDADKLSVMIAAGIAPARLALRQIQMGLVDIEAARPRLFFEDAQTVEPPKGAQDMVMPVVGTSAKCVCDPLSKCGRQGMPFSWCYVHESGDCPLTSPWPGMITDPAGRQHQLEHDQSADVQTSEQTPPAEDVATDSNGNTPRFWDYCVSPGAQEMEEAAHPGALKTVTSNCRCNPRVDILSRYEEDPRYADKNGIFDPKKVPWADRLTVEAMLRLRADPGGGLCVSTPSSGPYTICPASLDCVTFSQTAPDSVGLGPASATSAKWYMGTVPRTWDFCITAPAPTKPETTGSEVDQQEASGSEVDGQETAGSEVVQLISLSPFLVILLCQSPWCRLRASPATSANARPVLARRSARLAGFLPEVAGGRVAVLRPSNARHTCM